MRLLCGCPQPLTTIFRCRDAQVKAPRMWSPNLPSMILRTLWVRSSKFWSAVPFNVMGCPIPFVSTTALPRSVRIAPILWISVLLSRSAVWARADSIGTCVSSAAIRAVSTCSCSAVATSFSVDAQALAPLPVRGAISAVGNCPDDVLMEEEVQLKVQVEEERTGETHGMEKGEEQRVKERPTLRRMTWMTM